MDSMWGSSGILECCNEEEVTVGDMGYFHRVLCVHCGVFEDFYKDGYAPSDPLSWGVQIDNHKVCKACTHRTGSDLVFYGCLSCPKYG